MGLVDPQICATWCLPWILVNYWTGLRQGRARSASKSQDHLCLIVQLQMVTILANYEYNRRNPETGWDPSRLSSMDWCKSCKKDPNIVEVRRVLKIASAAKVEVADYFQKLLDASVERDEKVEEAISTFTQFFRAKKLCELRLRMLRWKVPFWMRCPLLWNRPMSKGLVFRMLYSSKDTCKGDGRISGFNFPLL